ncbi:OmpP1/FadL family transporter [Vibrio sp. SS-MA-C1-2]|uniref:outer membrane protein transport protein n=1 Tax=Vibrio sp. SS-MA-C1-2 TaxID=2908646 RepID=UPI001F256D19|nr:OmpP1/FadL family transporter [Vibrio sp. SS-MA-C1-2]UJF18730.1 OmpP1/FadL family transporter [Vibrio sp. SS-MA-C1-2]
MTNKNRLFSKSLLAVAITLSSGQALAAGFQLNAQSATGLGRAFAGDAVIADNASVMARNAAAMALFDEKALSLGFETITTMIDVSDATYTNIVGNDFDADYDDAGGTSVAPNIHFIMPINDTWAVGINGYSNFGTSTDFPDDYAGGEYGGKTEIFSANLGLAASYRLNEHWSFGAGLDFIYGKGTIKRSISDKQPSALPVPGVGLVPLAGQTVVDVDDATGFGVGFNVGTVYEINDNNRFGLSYHYSPDITAEDDDNNKITLPLPDMLEFSGYNRFTGTKFAVHYSIQWINWSEFDLLDFSGSGPYGDMESSKYEWKDGYHFALGGTYYLNNDWTLRAGYMYDISAQDEITSISVPDSDRQWFSAGFTYHINQKSNVDFGFTYLLGQDIDATEVQDISSINATTHADAVLVGLQYSRTF